MVTGLSQAYATTFTGSTSAINSAVPHIALAALLVDAPLSANGTSLTQANITGVLDPVLNAFAGSPSTVQAIAGLLSSTLGNGSYTYPFTPPHQLTTYPTLAYDLVGSYLIGATTNASLLENIALGVATNSANASEVSNASGSLAALSTLSGSDAVVAALAFQLIKNATAITDMSIAFSTNSGGVFTDTQAARDLTVGAVADAVAIVESGCSC